MKSNLNSLIASVLLCFTVLVGNAQDFQGKAYYFSKTTMDLDNWGGREMSEDMKKQIAERMKSMFEKTYVLTFNRSESLYKEEEKLETPGRGGGWGMMAGSFTAGPQYKNVKDQALLQEQEFFGKQFLITDEIPKLEWKLTGETKQIGQYMCMKATAIKTLEGFDFRSVRRRRPRGEKEEKPKDSTDTRDPAEEIEMPKEIEVTAWYTPQIPVNQGPGEYWGLPGLILEINADRTTILCSKIVLNPDEKETIKKPTKGKKVTQQEYNEIVEKKMKEMREMYGGRGRRGGMRPRG